MSISLPASLWQSPRLSPARVPSSAPAPVVAGAGMLSPEVLLEAGILSDTSKPQGALQRGRAMLRQGLYRQAKNVLQAHSSGGNPEVAAQIFEMLARCSAGLGGKDRPAFIAKAFKAYRLLGSVDGMARCERMLGDCLLEAGDFAGALGHYEVAANALRSAGHAAQAAVVASLQARAQYMRGSLPQALRTVESALAEATSHGDQRCEALVRLERARILVALGRLADAARDVIFAERVYAAAPDRTARAQSRLIRAEMLLASGDGQRAAAGLRRLLVDSADIEDISIRAWSQQLLGEALLDRDPSAARRYLSRGRHLYEALNATYPMTACDIALARVEHRLGLNPRGRLDKLSAVDFSQWASLQIELHIAQAESANDAQRCETLLAARRIALESGHQVLAFQVDRLLRQGPLPQSQSLQELTPVDTLMGLSNGNQSLVRAVAAMPFEDSSPVRMPRPRQRVSARSLIQVESSNPNKPALQAPRAAGLLRR